MYFSKFFSLIYMTFIVCVYIQVSSQDPNFSVTLHFLSNHFTNYCPNSSMSFFLFKTIYYNKEQQMGVNEWD